MLSASAMESSRATLSDTVMPPPSTPRGVKHKNIDKEAALPVSSPSSRLVYLFKPKHKYRIRFIVMMIKHCYVIC